MRVPVISFECQVARRFDIIKSTVFSTLSTAMLVLAVALPSMVTAAELSKPDSITVAYCEDCLPFEYKGDDGEAHGTIIGFWRLWSKKTRIKVNFMPAPWDHTLAMVRDGSADVHAGLFHNKERDAYLDYGAGLHKMDTHVFLHRDLPPLRNLQDLSAYKVGVLKGDFVEGYLKQRIGADSVVGFLTYPALIGAAKAGRIRVFAADTPTALHHLALLDAGEQFTIRANQLLYNNVLYAAAAEGAQDLLRIVNDGMALITSKEKRRIMRRRETASGSQQDDSLIVTISASHQPFSYIGRDGEPAGILVDIWKLWSQYTKQSIRFKALPSQAALDALQSGEADIHSGVFKNDARPDWMDFSTPVHRVRTAAYFPAGGLKPAPLDTLEGKRVGVIAGSRQESYLRAAYPKLKIQSRQNGQLLIFSLLSGDVDLIVNEAPGVEEDLVQAGLRGKLVRAPDFILIDLLYAGVAKGNGTLRDEINNGLALIPNARLVELERRWIPNPEDRFFERGTTALVLTETEEAWVKQNPILRVGNENDWKPFDFAENGEARGYSIDHLRLLAQKTGFRLKFVNGHSWAELLKLFRDGALDVLPVIAETPERREFIRFTQHYMTNPTILVTREDATGIKAINDLKGRRLAIVKDYYYESAVRRDYPDVEVVSTPSFLEGLEAVLHGEADAFIGSQVVIHHTIKEHALGGLRIAGRSGIDDLDRFKLKIGVAKSAATLAGILNKGMAALSDDEKQNLARKWLPGMTHVSGQPNRVALSARETEWLAEHPRLRLGVDPTWPPFEFLDEFGAHSGLASSYVSAVAERLNIEMKPLANLNWSQVLESARNGDVDILPAVMATADREKFLNFTRPYAKFHIVVATHKDRPFISGLEELTGKKVAVIKDYYIEEALQRDHGYLDLVRFDSVLEALHALNDDRVDAYVDSMPVIGKQVANLNLTNIKIAAPTDYEIKLSIGVRKDWPQLVGILNRALDDIGPEERRNIRNTWLTVPVQYGTDLKTIIAWAAPVGAVAAIVLLVIIAWNRRLGREVAERQNAENLAREREERLSAILEASPVGVSIIGEDGKRKFVNSRMANMLSRQKNDLIGADTTSSFVDPTARSKMMELFVNNGNRVDDFEAEFMRSDGSVFWVLVTMTNMTFDDQEARLSWVYDITERKQAEAEIERQKAVNEAVLTNMDQGVT